MNFKQVALALTLGTASVTANATLLHWGHGGHSCGDKNEPVCSAEWTDTWSGQQFLSADKGYTKTWNYTFDITDDGFTVGEDAVTGYELSLKLADDNDLDYFWFWTLDPETAKLLQPGQSVTWEVDTGTKDFAGTLEGITSLNDLGQLAISLIAKEGDFWLKGAELIACGIDNITIIPETPVAVSEPGTLALLGLGLLGLGAARRNQRKA